jgi:hypothetical protein
VAERIDNLTPFKGRKPIYPWHEWMNGTAWRIRRGEDFDVSAESMAQHIRNRARDRGLSAHARLTDDGEGVEFQVFKEAVA